MTDGLSEQWVTVGPMRLYSRMAVPATPRALLPIVLVHAYGTSSRYWLPFMRLLAPQYVVYTLDLPGHGHSHRAPFTLNFADTAATLTAWMDALALPQALVMGHSSGSQIVLHLAQRQPERVAGAVLLAPSLDERTRSALRQGLRLLSIFPAESLTLPFELARAYYALGLRHLAQTVEFDLETEFLGLLPHFPQPTAVVCGTLDRLVPPSWGRKVTSLLPNGQYFEVPGAAHAMQYSAPRRLLAVLAPFLTQVMPHHSAVSERPKA